MGFADVGCNFAHDDDYYCNQGVVLKDLTETPVAYLIGDGHDAARMLDQHGLLVEDFDAAAHDVAHIVVVGVAQTWTRNWVQAVAWTVDDMVLMLQ